MNNSLVVKFVVLSATAVGALVASAADYTWVGETADWSGTGNWSVSEQPSDWMDGNNAIFDDTGKTKAVTLGSDVSASRVTVNADYTFAGSGALSLTGAFAVGAGSTAVFDGLTLSVGGTPVNGATGTLEFKNCSTTFGRLVTTGTGTLVFDGGEHLVTATSTGASSGTAAVNFNEGHVAIKGGAQVTVTGSNQYSANSGATVDVSDGLLDLYKIGEFMNGFADWYGSSRSRVSSMTIRDKGTVIVKGYRLGKVVPSTFASYNQEYARTTLETGGVFVVHNFNMDGSGTFCGRLDFNGGTLVVTNENNTRFTVASVGGNWTNVILNVKEGGAHFKQTRKDCYANFYTPLVSAAEKDGGLTLSGLGFLYLGDSRWPSTFNGGVHLTGTGDICLIPTGYDSAFGAVPPAPTPNVFFETGAPKLHFGASWSTHPNRTFWIGTNLTATVGVAGGQTARITGVITDPGHSASLSRLRKVAEWNGCLEIGPQDGRTNTFGRLRVDGHLRHVAGTTLLTSTASGKTADNAPFYVCGKDSYSVQRGCLEVAGGTLKVKNSVWCDVSSWGQVIVTNGHLDVSATAEYLNGLTSPGRTIIGGNGLMSCNQLRISQTSSRIDGEPAAQVQLLKGGTLKVTKFWMDINKGQVSAYTGTVLLDGGLLVANANQANFLGEDDASGNWHRNIYVRVGENGAVVDTAGHAVTIKNPVLSGAASDGGFTKKGAGVLTLNSTNSYNGVTRVDAGQLKFTHANGFPGGDIEVSAAALKDNARTAELINAVNLTFRAGAKIRVVDTEGVTPETFGRKVILAKAANAISAVPPVVVVDKDGNEKSGGWEVRLSADGKTLSFGAERGSRIILR